jgi:uncharacterized protein involved in response to NO
MKNSYFFSQPHQPFFVLAVLNALLSMLLFMFMIKGIVVTEITATNYHAYAIIFLVFTPAFLGFLFTTFPRFSSTPPIAQKRYLRIFWLFLSGSILFIMGSLLTNIFSTIAMIILFVGHFGAINILLNVYFDSPHEEKHDQYWILVAFAFGFLSHFIFILSIWFPALHTLSVQIAIYLFLFLVAFSVAQRMIPFFSHCMVEKDLELLPKILVVLLAHVMLENSVPHSSFIADLVLVYFIRKELLRWRLPFPNPNPLLWILHLSVYWIPIAFLLSAISNLASLLSGSDFLFLDIHTLMLGFLFTVMIGFGTRVTIGHSGNTMQADRWTTLLFYGTQVVVVMRLLTSLAMATGWKVLLFFDISVTVWLLLFIAWASRFFAVLIFGKKLESKR